MIAVMTMTLEEFARLGGHARAKKLTAKQLRASARKAARARWAKRPASEAKAK